MAETGTVQVKITADTSGLRSAGDEFVMYLSLPPCANPRQEHVTYALRCGRCPACRTKA